MAGLAGAFIYEATLDDAEYENKFYSKATALLATTGLAMLQGASLNYGITTRAECKTAKQEMYQELGLRGTPLLSEPIAPAVKRAP